MELGSLRENVINNLNWYFFVYFIYKFMNKLSKLSCRSSIAPMKKLFER